MTDESLREARDELLRASHFDTEGTAQHMYALAEILRRLARQGGGTATLEISCGTGERGKLTLNTPVLRVGERFHRKRA